MRLGAIVRDEYPAGSALCLCGEYSRIFGVITSRDWQRRLSVKSDNLVDNGLPHC